MPLNGHALSAPRFGLAGGILLLGIGGGILLNLILGMEPPIILMVPVLFFALSPILLVRLEWAQWIFISVLILTLSFNIDQTFFLRRHAGGAQGLVVSLSGISVFFLFLVVLIEKMNWHQRRIYLFGEWLLPIAGLLVLALVSIINAKDKWFGIFEWLELFKMALVFWIVADFVAKTKERKWILIILFVGLGLESLIALAQLIAGSSLHLEMLGARSQHGMASIGGGSMSRVGGTLGGANSLALYLDFLLPIPFAMVLSSPLKRPWITAIVIIAIAALLVTLSRGGWLGFLIGAGIVIWERLRHTDHYTRVRVIAILLIILLIVLGAFFAFDNPIKERFTANDDGSAYVRIPLMKVAWSMIKANPLIGVGINNYTEVDQWYDTTPERVTSIFPLPVHCMYLLLAAECGITALALLFWILILALSKGIRLLKQVDNTDNELVIGILAGMIGFLFHCLIENVSIASYNFLPFWFFCGVLAGLSKPSTERQS